MYKMRILLIYRKLKSEKLLTNKYRMHNLYAIFAKMIIRIPPQIGYMRGSSLFFLCTVFFRQTYTRIPLYCHIEMP